MGLLVDGQWRDQWYDTKKSGGTFQRQEAQFRNWVTADGQAGPSGRGGFAAQSGRYHLYVSYACPWAHRTLIFRALKGLEDHISVSVVHPDMLSEGWTFETDDHGATGDTLMGHAFMRDVYLATQPDITTRVTVPVLWDTHLNTIVSNESSEIIRMFNSAFDGITGNTLDLWPADMRDDIEDVNSWIYPKINNGVYMAGFATAQGPYDRAVNGLFEALDQVEARLATQDWLMGDRLTEADIRLFTTLVRFDMVYHLHFKCNRKRIIDYPQIWDYTRALYQHPLIRDTVNMEHIVRHYHYSHETINPHRIIPTNPVLNWEAPTTRNAQTALG